MAALTAFDVVVLILVVLGAFGGLARGFVGEVVSLLAWIAGIVAVRLFYAPATVIAAKLTGTEAGGAILAFAALFLTAFILVRGIGGSLSKGTKASVIGPIDRLLGLGFGAAKGVLGAALLFLLVNMVFDTIDPGKPSPEWLAKARTAPTLALVSKALTDFVEARRHGAPDGAAPLPDKAGPDKAGPDKAGPKGQGYDGKSRSALDQLLDRQEKASPSTPI